jgi:cell shape-determining protein MreC
MHEVAYGLAAKEGFVHVMADWKDKTIGKAASLQKGNSAELPDELEPLLEKQLSDYVAEKRETYLKEMLQLAREYLQASTTDTKKVQ